MESHDLTQRRPRKQHDCRLAVEAGMIALIRQLCEQDYSEASVALALADASEEYVIRLASDRILQ